MAWPLIWLGIGVIAITCVRAASLSDGKMAAGIGLGAALLCTGVALL